MPEWDASPDTNDGCSVLIFTDSNGALGFGRYSGPYRIATELRKAGFSVQVVEFFADLTLEEVHRVASKYVGPNTLWAGFSSTLFAPGLNSAKIAESIANDEYQNSMMIQNWQSQIFPKPDEEMHAIFELLKKLQPQIQIVVGGSKAARGGFRGVDWWIWGEADISAVEFSLHCRDSKHQLKHSSFTGGSQRVLSTDYPITNFSSYEISWHSSDHIFEGEHLPIEISRGCIFKCSYCSFKNLGRGKSELVRTTDSLRHELLNNWSRHGTYGYMLSDDTFNDSLEKVSQFHALTKELPFQLEWAGYCRVDLFAKQKPMIKLVKDSGAKFINLGIETFHPQAGRAVGKGMNPDLVKQTLYELKEAWGNEVLISCNFIVGLNFEPESSIWKTVDWLLGPGSPVDSFNFTPLYVIHNRRDVFDKTAVFANQIGLEPEKNGYEYDPENSYWKHDFMDQTRAHEIVAEIYRIPDVKKRTLANRIGFYGRLRNLGIGLDKLTDVNVAESELLSDIFRRRGHIRKTYLDKLLGSRTAMQVETNDSVTI